MKRVCVVLLLCAAAAPLAAQDSTAARALSAPRDTASARSPAAALHAPMRVWLGLGTGGVGAPSRDEVGIVYAHLAFQKRAHYLALRGALMGDPFGEGASDAYGELGALYGRAFAPRHLHAALAAGLALTVIDPCPSGPSCTTLGLPVLAEAAVQPVPVIGIGAQLFANINPERAYRGFAIFVQLGWMP